VEECRGIFDPLISRLVDFFSGLEQKHHSRQSGAWIDNHEPAGRDEHLFRLLLAPGNAAATNGFDAIAGAGVTTLSLGRWNA
jgi:hypothetical protein